MIRHTHFTKLLILGIGVFVTGKSPLRAASTNMFICESNDDSCSQPNARRDIVWTFDGIEGRVGSSPDHADSRLTIEKFDSKSLVVRRVDRGGATAGLSAVYTGIIDDGRISGTIQWLWPNHPEHPATGKFAGTMAGATASSAVPSPTPSASRAASMPTELLVCENGGNCNAAWVFEGSKGTGTWFERQPVRGAVTIERFDPDYIVIRRTDSSGRVVATYTGSPKRNGYSGTIVGPQGNTGKWTATIPETDCSSRRNLEPAAAMHIGQYALMFKRNTDALSCYLVAAKAGDATAQAAVGLFYYQGRPDIPQSYRDAFLWLRKAADQGVYSAQRTVAEMFAAGQGTERDGTLSSIYTARADEQKHDLERRQDLAEREKDRQNQLLSSFVLGASFGLFF